MRFLALVFILPQINLISDNFFTFKDERLVSFISYTGLLSCFDQEVNGFRDAYYIDRHSIRELQSFFYFFSVLIRLSFVPLERLIELLFFCCTRILL